MIYLPQVRLKVINGNGNIFISKKALNLLIRKVKVKRVRTVEIVISSIVMLFFAEAFVERVKRHYAASVTEFTLNTASHIKH
jgi:hypothetical protein